MSAAVEPAERPITLLDLAGQYMVERMVAGSLTFHTAGTYRMALRAFATTIGAKGPGEVTEADVRRWLEKGGLNQRWANLTALRGFYAWAAASGHTTTDPTAGIKVPARTAKGERRPSGANYELMTGFQRDQVRRHLSPVTIGGNRHRLWSFALFLGERHLVGATVHDIESWLDSRRLGARSTVNYLYTLRAFYDYVQGVELRIDNPARAIRPPRQARLLPRPIGEDDLAFAIKAAEPQMRAWLTLAAYAGLRCKEIAGLRRSDLLLDRDPPSVVVADGKGHHQRVVPLNPKAEAALHAYGLPLSGFIFRSPSTGKPYQAPNVSLYVGRYLHGWNIDASAHQLRHRFGTAVYGKTRDIRMTQELLGHADVSTTAIYAAYDPAEAAQVVRELP